MSEIETKMTTEKISETKSWFFEKINKIDHQPDSLRRERTQINKIRNERGDVTIDTSEIHRIIRDYYENYMLTNWTIYKKWINSQKHRLYQD